MHTFFDANTIEGFEQRFRTTFINSLNGFKSLALIGSNNSLGQTNLAIFNSIFHLGAHPPLFGFVIRPDVAERHTLQNILETHCFTLNHVHEKIYKQAHQTSARYTKTQSEFKETGLSPVFLHDFPAPFVAESQIKIAAKLVRRIDIQENGTIMLIGAIEFVICPQQIVGADGFVDLEKAGTLTCCGLDSYHITQRLARLTYAKPGKPVSELR